MSKRIRICIALSLLLNLLLLGVTFGYTGKHFMGTRSEHHVNLHDLTAVLPEEKREKFEKPVAMYEHDAKQWRDQLTNERKKAAAIIQAKSFDKDAYFAQIQVIQRLRLRMIQNTAEMISHIAEQATDDEREDLGNVLLSYIQSKE